MLNLDFAERSFINLYKKKYNENVTLCTSEILIAKSIRLFAVENLFVQVLSVCTEVLQICYLKKKGVLINTPFLLSIPYCLEINL